MMRPLQLQGEGRAIGRLPVYSITLHHLFLSPVMLCGSVGSAAGQRVGCSAETSPGNRQVSGCQPAGTNVCSGPTQKQENSILFYFFKE